MALTRISVRTPPPSGVGTLVVARSGVGWLRFDDPMRVTQWQAGTHCRFEKAGRVVTGWAEIDVLPDRSGDSGSLVRRREDVRVRGVPRALDRATVLAGRLAFGRLVDALLAP